MPKSTSGVGNYVVGFVLSLALTLGAYYLISQHRLFGAGAIVAILVLAIVQLFVQLVFFLHLGHESKPQWNLIMAAFAGMVVLIVVVGSLWIMNNLNYHMTSPSKTDHFIEQDEGIHNR